MNSRSISPVCLSVNTYIETIVILPLPILLLDKTCRYVPNHVPGFFFGFFPTIIMVYLDWRSSEHFEGIYDTDR